jgi:hypothetical protein
LQLLFKYGADLAIQNIVGTTLFHAAVEGGNEQIIRVYH